jgi:hypothetical protein
VRRRLIWNLYSYGHGMTVYAIEWVLRCASWRPLSIKRWSVRAYVFFFSSCSVILLSCLFLSLLEYDPKYTSRSDSVFLGSCNSYNSATYPMRICSVSYVCVCLYVCTYMYMRICVYIPVPVPVQWAVIRGTNKREMIHIKINWKKCDIFIDKALFLRKIRFENLSCSPYCYFYLW